ncbi:MAG: RbsD/FucU domain-containing protein [Planctomycetaceae bacterium]|nr:RbsD/FucU domain-containing protein [Planctomycetaceae bacterium]
MLKGIPPIMSPELMEVLMRMGHGDDLVIADGNFPAETMGRRVVRTDGHGVPEILDAVLTFVPVDTFVSDPVKVMQPVDPDVPEPPIWTQFRDQLARHEARPIPLTLVERFEFYRLAQSAFAVIATGETAIYANIILKKGVVTS